MIRSHVLREYDATVTRSASGGTAPPLEPVLANISRFQVAYTLFADTHHVTQALLTLVQAIPVGGRYIHDANIVATMCTDGVSELYTHNVAHFARFAAVITVRPLVALSEE